MYDQYGFYSENGTPAGGAGAGRRAARPQHGFRRLRFFRRILTRRRRRRARRGGCRRNPSGAGNFQDIFSQCFGRGERGRRSTTPEKGADLEYGLDIDFWQAISGTQVRLNITRHEVCATCNGTGARSRSATRFARNATAAAT